MFIDPTGRWICTLESYAFNPDCDEWVNDALNKLETQGGVPGQRLIAFFERRDSDLRWHALGCIVFPPLGGRIWGVRISFTPLIHPLHGHPSALAIPPDQIVINSVRINGDTAELNDVATFGHEISHLEQGWPKFYSVHAEMLSAILTYRLETRLGIIANHHSEGVDIREGYGNAANPQPWDPWTVSDLEAFNDKWGFPYPLVPVTGFLPRNWFDQWGVIPFRPPTPGPTPTPPPPGGTPTSPTLVSD